MSDSEIDQFLMFYAKAVLASKDANEWAKGFTKSILGHAKRKGRDWKPSAKQEYWMRKLVQEFRQFDNDIDLVEVFE